MREQPLDELAVALASASYPGFGRRGAYLIVISSGMEDSFSGFQWKTAEPLAAGTRDQFIRGPTRPIVLVYRIFPFLMKPLSVAVAGGWEGVVRTRNNFSQMATISLVLFLSTTPLYAYPPQFADGGLSRGYDPLRTANSLFRNAD